MADYTQFTATTPEIVPATTETTYDKYWLARLNIMAPDPTGKVIMMAGFMPCRDVEVDDGEGGTVTVKELKPNAKAKRIVIEDLFGEAEADAALQAAIEGILAVLKTKGVADGVL